MRHFVYACTIAALTACGTSTSQQPSHLNVDQNLEIGAARQQRLSDFYTGIMPLVERSQLAESSGKFAPSEILPFRFTEAEANAVNSAFPEGFQVVCQLGKCRGNGSGRKVETTLSQEKEASRISFKPQVEISFKHSLNGDKEIIEICRVKGVQLKVSFLWADLDGGKISYSAGSAGHAVQAMMDAGSFGSYPSNGCN
jgi:hypothetical protein